MRRNFPNRNTFEFGNGVVVNSEFEAGNLWRCQEFLAAACNEIELAEDEEGAEGGDGTQQMSNSQASGTAAEENGDNADPNGYSLTDTALLFAPTEDELYCYDLWVCPDSLPYIEGSKQRAQFYFDLTGLPQ